MGIPSWAEFLNLLRGDMIFIPMFAGIIVSLVIEFVPWFQARAPKYKTLVFALVCLAIPAVATGLGIVTGVLAVGPFGDIWWPVVYAGFVSSGVGALVHPFVPGPLTRPSTYVG